MSDMLRAWGIDVMTPYVPDNLDRAKPDLVASGVRQGDVVLVMSNGAFDGFIPSLLEALRS